jgi:hypothetical protein
VAICFNLAEMLFDSWTIRPFDFFLAFLPSPQAGGAFQTFFLIKKLQKIKTTALGDPSRFKG